LAADAIACNIDEVVHQKAFELAAGKIDQVSGDIRVCFEIMRQVM
jgi:hypothetical protein